MSSNILHDKCIARLSIYPVLLLILFQISISGQDFSLNLKINHLTQGDQNTDGGNSIVVNGNNVYVLWQDLNTTFSSYISKSTNGGTSFGNGIKIGGNDPHLFGAMAANNSGTLFTVWSGVVNDNLTGVYFSRSTDQAATFSTPVTISSDGFVSQIAVNGDNVYVCFFKPKADNKIGLFFARSTNGGANFEIPYEVTDAVNANNSVKFDSPNSISVDSQGNIYCIWNDGRRGGTGTDIYLAKSTNNGVSFGTNILVNNLTGSSNKIRTGPSLAVSGSNVYVVWRQEDDNSGTNRKILFSKSTNGGSSFGSETEISTGGSGSSSLAINTAGEIYFAYSFYESSGKYGLYCKKSDDGGNSFPVSVFISDVNANVKNLSVFVDGNDMLNTVWTDERSGNEDVYFSKGKITTNQPITSFEFILSESEEVVIPPSNPWGLIHAPDGAISYQNINNEIRMWISTSRWTTLLRGPDFNNLVPFPLDGDGKALQVFSPSNTGFDSTYAGAYSVIPAHNNQDLLMIYHAENHPCPNNYSQTKFGMGLAKSSDGGFSWQRRGQIITTNAPPVTDNCSFFEWGVGNPTVYKSTDGNYLYMLFGEWLRGAPYYRPDGLYLARAPIESDGEPGSWQKYSNGTFTQAGLGGLGSLVIYPPTGTNPNYAAQPSVSFNTYLYLYLLVFQSRMGLHLATSVDGVNWNEPKLLWEVPDVYIGNSDNKPWVAYFSLISADQPSQMTTSRTGYLYFARGYPNWNPPHMMSRRSFEIKLPASVETPQEKLPVEFQLAQNFPNPFNPTTTIKYKIPKTSFVSLKVFDILGKEVATLVNKEMLPGSYDVKFDGRLLSSGVYVYKLQTESYSQAMKMLILK